MAEAIDYRGCLAGQIEGQTVSWPPSPVGPVLHAAGEPARGAGKISALNSVWRHLIFVALFPIPSQFVKKDSAAGLTQVGQAARPVFMAITFLTKIFGSRNDRLIKKYRHTVAKI
ncbi:MAG TPA: hypothetical protein VFX90_06790, partial [Rhodoferax sp.]|nr:hypothetical protein [Rhodoferax sp.]